MMPGWGGDADFYIGWQDPPPPGARRALFAAARTLLVLAAVVALLLAWGQGPLRGGAFEYGVERSFEGLLSEGPAPCLRVKRDGQLADVSRWLLVAPGKHGAHELVAGLDGRRVRATGSLVYRDGQTMLELSGRPLELDPVGAPAEPAASAAAAFVALGRVTLVGEIVDSKCYLGVMVPGEGRGHRACAIRCLSGGIPPVFRVATDDGDELCLLLVGRDGRALNAEILPRVAEPLRITGEVERQDDLLVLRAEPAEFEAAPAR
jgi:hypothetical protein